ncbi:nitrate/nitrite transporter NrtS [Roseobacter sp. YSTF-M11]|uniref:Nitrate/nitrite transporter NrtS n=1 Tax=Roseobacter insulae TaxID=2859783 RepID=A0A9X1FRK9_9RHOB|nr:nitrate/nitrite transporter NrtS [Roseobacter insulae]
MIYRDVRLADWWTTYGPMVRRAFKVALFVGPILACINHGDAFFAGTLTPVAVGKIAVTFFVPFCVSFVSSILTFRQQTKHAKIDDSTIARNANIRTH